MDRNLLRVSSKGTKTTSMKILKVSFHIILYEFYSSSTTAEDSTLDLFKVHYNFKHTNFEHVSGNLIRKPFMKGIYPAVAVAAIHLNQIEEIFLWSFNKVSN